MIGWLIVVGFAALLGIVIYAHWAARRERRKRERFIHVTGARPWWGKR